MESIHKQIQFCNRNKCEMCTFYSEVKPSSNVSSKASTYLENQISHILCDACAPRSLKMVFVPANASHKFQSFHFCRLICERHFAARQFILSSQ